jgi:hypothetical protein
MAPIAFAALLASQKVGDVPHQSLTAEGERMRSI